MNHIRTIAQLGDPVLRETASRVDNLQSVDIKQLISDMSATLANTQGVGLAAPQISESKRVIIVASRPTARYPYAPLMSPTVMFNPEFEAMSGSKEKDWEGCLSIPGIRALVPRFKTIRVRYMTEDGTAVQHVLEDFVARVFQHEIDHLDGNVYLDRVESSKDIVSESEFLKRFAVGA